MPELGRIAPTSGPTRGPLVVDNRNPRYFRDADGQAVLLAGSHTWATLQEAGIVDPPPIFDWTGWLGFMQGHGHNFMRLWMWENAKWGSWWPGDYFFEPLPWARTGPGNARDGKPRFDLTRFDEEFFDRLRTRTVECRDAGIYIAYMLFQGWSGGPKPFDTWTADNPVEPGPNPWHGHPFCAENNVNGIDGSAPGGEGDEWVHTLRDPDVLRLLETYVERVVETIGDLDNVMYEVGNEFDGTHENSAWQYHMISRIREYEQAAGVARHPVLMTAQYPNADNHILYASAADAVSPFGWHRRGGEDWQYQPPADYLGKVVISDTDHLWGAGGTSDWVWRTVTRGHNVLYMDTWGYTELEIRGPEPDEGARLAMGRAAALAKDLDFSRLEPSPDLVSTGFALAERGRTIVAYNPYGGRMGVDLTDIPGALELVWIHPEDADQDVTDRERTGGAFTRIVPPGPGSWVLCISAQSDRERA
jgi:hypothetical protein